MKRTRQRPTPAASRRRPPAAATTDRTRAWQVMAGLVILTVVIYAPVWQFDFIALDDPQYVYANPDLAAGLTARSVAWTFGAHAANWHPLTWLSHAADISLFGMNSGRHHAMNLLLHLVNTVLLFAVIRRATGSVGRSAFVAATFAAHPLHVESVAWVAERKDVLSGVFFVLTLGAYVRYADSPTRGRFASVAMLLALGLMAKPMLVTIPFLLLLLDYWPLGRLAGGPAPARTGSTPRTQKTLRRLILEKLPLLALVAASSIVTFYSQRLGGAVKDLEVFPLAMRLQNAVVSYLDYLRQTVWPSGLGMFYPFPSALPWAWVGMAAIVLAGVTAGAVRTRRRVPAIAVGWFWYLGMLVPVIGLVQVGDQARADRYMYLPMIGLTIAVAWAAAELVRTDGVRRAVAAAGAALVLASGVLAHAQVQHWRETVALFRHTAAVTEDLPYANNFRVYYGLAEYLHANNRSGESIPAHQDAIRKNPSYMPARFGLVRALLATGQTTQAIAALQEVVALDPSSVDSRMSLGVLLMETQRTAEAVEQFTEAVRLEPAVADRRWRLAVALTTIGRLAEALPHFAEAVRLSPGEAPIRNDYGWALLRYGRTAEALTQFSEVLRQDPQNEIARRGLTAVGGR